MSVAFTREESAETAAAIELPDRPISPHPNLVTQSGLKALDAAMAAARAAYHAAKLIEDLNERRSAVAAASRDMRYFSEHLRTAQLMPDPVERDTVVFGRRPAIVVRPLRLLWAVAQQLAQQKPSREQRPRSWPSFD